MTALTDLPTPALLLDRPRFEANCARMRDRVSARGTRLRPHMKTLKAIDAARIAIDPDHGGIAVSTLREADYFAGHGIADIQLAVCLPPGKLAAAAEITRKAPHFSFFLDTVEAAVAAAAFAHAQGITLSAWIEVDCGEHRTGVDPDGDALIAIAQVLAESPVALAGVATHGGHSYRERQPSEIAAIAELERRAVVHAADRLRAEGHDVPGVSAGSTPTAIHGRSADGLTELRPGVYMAGDLFQAAIGSHEPDDMAVSVLASVISHHKGRIMLDAGGLALSKDRSTAALGRDDMGYGLVADLHGRPSFGRLIVETVHQEHGAVPIADEGLAALLPVGAKVRVFPNHVCMTTAMYESYHLTDGDRLTGEWEKTGGW
ncbi:alanine racemase [Allosphingosinicella indica]|uniref:D-serine deaminase, pyridoxal phosphate-dependent n=1 Tax=Allosphingosinicella indica TaxID=941907 RepID=A0A1X7GGM3_9SPHN|nr:alanine racemase [Allosphingosinicella indica]SMF69518.1 D-serine deaminase, pyridoxal phosphate-dependent [Allosphingosinicella indica]